LNASSASSVAISKVEAKAAKKAAKAAAKAAKKAAKAAKKAAKASAKAAKKAAKRGIPSSVIAGPSFSSGVAAFPTDSASDDVTTPSFEVASFESETLVNPLPAGLPLLLTGLLALGGVSRKRKAA
jgi:translation initiation factor 2B subunit (eIF-2B alpha/beta/delta family)